MKLSVCIPVYKVEAYIERCARSLFEQTYQDIEYIFVDDCSPDDSIGVVQRLVAADESLKSRVKFIANKKGEGALVSRQKALASSTGELVTFLDSDDWVDLDLYEKMVAKFTDREVGMVFAPMVRNENGPMRGVQDLDFVGTGLKYLDNCRRVVAFSSMVNKVYRRELALKAMEGLPPGLKIAEDRTFITQLALSCLKVRSVTHSAYHYRVNETSVSNQLDGRRILDDLTREYEFSSSILPPEKALNLRKMLLTDLIFLGMKFGELSQAKARDYLIELHRINGLADLRELDLPRRVVIGLTSWSYLLAKLFCAILRLKGSSGL